MLKKNERFSIKLSINDNIICQRYFNIDYYDSNVRGSCELIDAINYSASLIQNDLNSKSRVYMWYTAPFVFDTIDDFNNYVNNTTNKKLSIGQHVVIKSDKSNDYTWYGDTLKAYPINSSSEFTKNVNDEYVLLKLTFMDGDNELCSRGWNANVYPNFVRGAIDISNSKGKSDFNPPFSRFKDSLIYAMSCGKSNLIGTIIRIFQDACRHSQGSTFSKLQNYVTDKTIESLHL